MIIQYKVRRHRTFTWLADSSSKYNLFLMFFFRVAPLLIKNHYACMTALGLSFANFVNRGSSHKQLDMALSCVSRPMSVQDAIS